MMSTITDKVYRVSIEYPEKAHVLGKALIRFRQSYTELLNIVREVCPETADSMSELVCMKESIVEKANRFLEVDNKAMEVKPTMLESIEGRIDGACSGNPGPIGYAYVAKDSQGGIRNMKGEDYGTNNIAEYKALLLFLEFLQEQQKIGITYKTIYIYSDSKLLVNQVNKEWKCKDSTLYELRAQAWSMMNQISNNFVISHIPREENVEADELASLVVPKSR